MRTAESLLKQSQEESRQLRLTCEKQDGQLKVTSEQLENCKKTLEDLSIKKHQELELLNKEISSLSLKERDAKQRAYLLEGQCAEVKDELRLVS